MFDSPVLEVKSFYNRKPYTLNGNIPTLYLPEYNPNILKVNETCEAVSIFGFSKTLPGFFSGHRLWNGNNALKFVGSGFRVECLQFKDCFLRRSHYAMIPPC